MLIFNKSIWAKWTQNYTWSKFFKDVVLILSGMFLGAAAIYYFAVPYNLITGTVVGLCMVINHFIGGTPDTLSLWMILVNVILLVTAFLLIGNEFGVKTVFTSIFLGPCMQLLDKIYPYTNFTHEMIDGQLVQVRYSVLSADMSGGDVWFDILCFCFLLAVGQAILFRSGASTGGFDIVAKLLYKFFHIELGTGVTICGACACALGFFINDFRMVVIGIITTWVNGVFIDYFMANFNRRKRVCVISEDYDKIRDYIIHSMNRGCSLYPLRGGYSDKEYTEVQTLLTQDEYGMLLEYIEREHIHAFMTAGNCSEVYGLWRPSVNPITKEWDKLHHKKKSAPIKPVEIHNS